MTPRPGKQLLLTQNIGTGRMLSATNSAPCPDVLLSQDEASLGQDRGSPLPAARSSAADIVALPGHGQQLWKRTGGVGVRATGGFLGKEARISPGLEDSVWTPGASAALWATCSSRPWASLLRGAGGRSHHRVNANSEPGPVANGGCVSSKSV